MIEVRLADLATVDADAIVRPVAADWAAVTPATRRLELAAGPEVEEQCRRLGELPVGSAAITAAGALKAEYLIHVVVRSASQPVTENLVVQGLRNGLRRAREWGLQRLAVAPLGTGAGNLDAERSAELMVPLLLEEVAAGEGLREVVLAVEGEYERDAFETVLRRRQRRGATHEEPDAPEAPEG